MAGRFVDVYAELKAAGVPLDNHESDLYALATEEARRIVKGSGWYGVEVFRSQIDGQLWIEIPFAFYPFRKEATR